MAKICLTDVDTDFETSTDSFDTIVSNIEENDTVGICLYSSEEDSNLLPCCCWSSKASCCYMNNNNMESTSSVSKLKVNHEQTETFQVKPLQKSWTNYHGILYALISALCYSALLVIIKSISTTIHPLTQSIWRYAVYTLINIIVIIWFLIKGIKNGESVWNVEVFKGVSSWAIIVKVCIGGGIGCTSTLLESLSLKYLSVADSIVVSHISLVFVLILAHFILNEKCSVFSTLMAICVIAGVFLIARPPFLTGAVGFSTAIAIGLAIKLFDGLFAAIYAISIRNFRNLHFAFLSLIIGIVGLILAIISSFSLKVFSFSFNNDENGWKLIAYLIILGILHFCANICLIQAFKCDKAGRVTLIRSSTIPLVILWQIIFLNQLPDIWTISGSLLVCLGVVLTSIRKLTEEMPVESNTRKNLKCCV